MGRRGSPRPFAGRPPRGDPPGPDGVRAAHPGDAAAPPRRVHGRSRAGCAGGTAGRGTARPDRAASDGRGVPESHPGPRDAGRLLLRVRTPGPGPFRSPAGAVLPHREGCRFPRLQDVEEPAGQHRQVERRGPRHPAPRHQYRSGGREQALRIRRHPQSRRSRHPVARDRPGGTHHARSISTTAT